MNREIKFRIWTKNERTSQMYMIEPFTLDKDFDCLSGCFDGAIMQYTGLKDKNGKEIYEGDVLKSPYPNCKNIEIKWMTGGCCNFVATGWDWDQDCIKNFEVIGNIYENPELI